MTTPQTQPRQGSEQDLGASADAETGSKATPEARSGLRPAGYDPARIAEFVAERLGKAQRRVIMSLTEDWGKAACHQTARRMFYGVTLHRYTVVHHKHRTDNCWCLSKLGVAVKAAIAMEARQGPDRETGLDAKRDSAGRNAASPEGVKP